MRTLSMSDYKLFEQIVSLKQGSLMKTMDAYLRRNYTDVFTTNKYICAKGTIPVALVAHLDTVFKAPVENLYYDTRKNVMWSPEGLGADDRAGVFAIVKIIKMGYRPHIIFTTDEEIGGIGAEQLAKDMEFPFEDMKYIIELDRRGTNDCVFYDCDNPAFTEYVESFGFTEAWGSFSDISFICPSWMVAGVNLSIGYRDEHSYSETLHISPFLSTIDKVVQMLKDAENCEHFYYVPSKFSYSCAYGYGPTGAWDYPTEDDKTQIKCHNCHNNFSEYELIPVKSREGQTVFYCPDCIVSNVNWCYFCNEPFEVDLADPKKHVCKDCEGKYEDTKECSSKLKKSKNSSSR